MNDETLSLIRADVARVHETYGSYLYAIHPGAVAVLLYRFAHRVRDLGPVGRLLSRALSLLNIVLTGADYHARAEIGPGFFVPHAQATILGEGVRAGANFTIYAGVVLGAGPDEAFPTVGDDVTFWSKASAIGGVHVGDGADVGAHALVVKDVPAGHVALGVPAVARPRKPASV